MDRSAVTFVKTPAFLTALACAFLCAAVILSAGGDPLALARIGTYFSQGDPAGSRGYDGQFIYYIARDLTPASVAPLLDVPAYRYQRILLPLLARLLAFGNEAALPWTLAFLGVLSQFAGTWAVSRILETWGVNRWLALVYGLWVGYLLAVRLDLPEPLAYGLVAAAFLARLRRKERLSWLFYALALFAREVALVFVVAQWLAYAARRRWAELAGLTGVAILPYVLFQLWLWRAFGAFGLGSGGDMATPFEWIPFMGLVRIFQYSPSYFLAMLVVFGPFIIIPSLWAAYKTLIQIKSGEINVVVLALGLHALMIMALPFSTYREPGGLLRIACGFVLAFLLFAARYKEMRVLRYTWLWLVLGVFLLKS